MRDLNAWLDRKKPYQREVLFAIAFDLCALAVLAAVGVGLVLAWPSLLSLVLICAALMAVPIALVGQLAGYRVEDRRVARIERLVVDEALKRAAEPRQPSDRPGAWIIRRTSCMCGGNWAWLCRRDSGAYEMQGCVCHHPWTLALRAGGRAKEAS